MAGGFFYSIGYISTKIENLGKTKFTNPTTAFSKSLLEGSNHAKKDLLTVRQGQIWSLSLGRIS